MLSKIKFHGDMRRIINRHLWGKDEQGAIIVYLKDIVREMYWHNRRLEVQVGNLKRKVQELYADKYERKTSRYYRNQHREEVKESEAANDGKDIRPDAARPDYCERPAETMVRRSS